MSRRSQGLLIASKPDSATLLFIESPSETFLDDCAQDIYLLGFASFYILGIISRSCSCSLEVGLVRVLRQNEGKEEKQTTKKANRPYSCLYSPHYTMLHPHLPLSVISLLAFATAIHATPSSPPQPSTTTTSGCGSPLPKELTIGGSSYNFTSLASNSSATHPLRAYSLAIPVDYRVDEPAPLILSFHGRGETNGD